MGGDLTQALRIANSGLLVGQQSLDVVARNIANVNTPGYSRKVINLEQQTLAGHGAGVQFGALSRRLDQSLMSLLRRETGTLNQRDVQTDTLDRLQQLFGTPESNTSISHVISELQASIEALSVTPQDGIEQQTMVRWGSEVTSLLRRSSQEIQDLRREADSRIGTAANVAIYDDFAHHPTAIATTLAGLRARIGAARLLAVMEPRSNSMRQGAHAQALPGAFDAADQVFVLARPELKWDAAATLGAVGGRLVIAASVAQLLDQVATSAKPGDHVLFMSNGGFEGASRRLLECLQAPVP